MNQSSDNRKSSASCQMQERSSESTTTNKQEAAKEKMAYTPHSQAQLGKESIVEEGELEIVGKKTDSVISDNSGQTFTVGEKEGLGMVGQSLVLDAQEAKGLEKRLFGDFEVEINEVKQHSTEVDGNSKTKKKGWKHLARQGMVTDKAEEALKVTVGVKRLTASDSEQGKNKLMKTDTAMTDIQKTSGTVVDPVTSVHHEQC